MKSFLLSVAAGACIGLGGTVFLRLKDTFPCGNVIGAFLFSIGLFTICTRGYNLFTGKACYIPGKSPRYLLDLCIIWLGNFAGCMGIASLERLTGIYGGENGLAAVSLSIVNGKMETSYLSLFVLGALCNICIFIAVDGYKNNPHEIGKYLALFLGVMVFILCGTEHCVADMYYWCVSGVLYDAPGESLLRLIVVSIGNVAGGLILPLVEYGNEKLTW